MSQSTGAGLAGRHIGRSWRPLHDLEDECPCPKAPCGLVVAETADPACPQHAFNAGRSLREIHTAAACQDRINATGRFAPEPKEPTP